MSLKPAALCHCDADESMLFWLVYAMSVSQSIKSEVLTWLQ